MTAVQKKKYLNILTANLKNPFWLKTMAKYSMGSAKKMLDDHFKDEKLKTLIAWLVCYGGTTLHKVSSVLLMGMWAAYHYGGYYYFEGGSQSVSNALADVIKENGGTIKLSTMASKIIIENNKAVAVKTDDDDLYKCRYVVSNANAPLTINQMAGREHFSKKFLNKMDSYKVGATCVCVYLGVNRDYTEYFKGAHTIAVSNRWTVPEDFDLMVDSTPENADMIIANYSEVDPQCAPEGKNVIAMVASLSYEYENGWHKNESRKKYTALKNKVAKILIKRAEEHLPELSKNIEKIEVATPHTMERYTLNPGGTLIGWEISMKPWEIQNRLPQQTPVKNLYLAGAWQAVGGQSPVVMSGLNVGNKILKKEKLI